MLERLKKILQALSARERGLLRCVVALTILASITLGIRILVKHLETVPKVGGVYTEGIVGQPTMVNPILSASNGADRDLVAILFEDLLALSVTHTHSTDGKIWTVTLPQNSHWSDGEPLTADDALFTLELIQDSRVGSGIAPTWQGVVAERVSDHEIRFALKTPYAFFEDNLKELRIIPRHIFGNIPSTNLRLSDFNLEPVGSGPYSFVGYDKRKDGFITAFKLRTNPYYAGKKPYISEIDIKFFTDNEELIRAFNRREIDSFGGQDYELTKKIRVGFQEENIELPRYYGLFFNTALHPALKEQNIREVLSRVIDKETIVKKQFENFATVVTNFVEETSGAADAPISIEEANTRLENAGWKLLPDGVRGKTVGKLATRLEFDIVVPQIQFLIDTANNIKEKWAKIGVKLTTNAMPPENVLEQAIKTRNYHMLLFGQILKNNPDIFAFWHSSERFYPGLNLSVYENKKVDALLEKIRKNFEETTRKEDVKKLNDLLEADYPAILLYAPTYQYIHGKQLKGFHTENPVTPANRLDEVENWYLKTAWVLR